MLDTGPRPAKGECVTEHGHGVDISDVPTLPSCPPIWIDGLFWSRTNNRWIDNLLNRLPCVKSSTASASKTSAESPHLQHRTESNSVVGSSKTKEFKFDKGYVDDAVKIDTLTHTSQTTHRTVAQKSLVQFGPKLGLKCRVS